MEDTQTQPGQTQAVSDDGSASWAAAAQPAAQPSQPSPSQPAQPDAAQPSQPNPSQPAMPSPSQEQRDSLHTESPQVQTQLQYVPMPMRPVRTGIVGLIDKIGDVLAGTTKPELYEDAQGNKFVYHPEMTHGQQWQRIGAEAIMGAASGLANGQGRGGAMRAAAAGVQTGMQFAQHQQDAERQMNADARQSMLDKANAQMMRMDLAEKAWKLSRLQPEADEHAAQTASAQGQKYAEMHGQMIGTMAHAYDLSSVLKSTPDLAAQMVKKGTINLIPHYERGDDGNVHLAGVEVWKMPDGWRNEMLPAKSSFDWFNPQSGQIEQHTASDPMTAGEQSDYHTSAAAAQMKWKSDQAEQKLKDAQTRNQNSEADERGAESGSKVRKNNAEADEAEARAHNLKTLGSGANPDGTPNPRFEALAQALYEGDITAQDLKREAKGAGLDPNQIMGRAVEIGNEPGAKYGKWSESLIKSELHFANDNKVTAALDGIDRLLGRNGIGPLDQVIQTAKEADLGTHGAFNSLNLAARRFFGDTKAKNLETAISESRRSVAGLIGNPLLGGGETDKKLEQAMGLLGKSPTLENLTGANELIKAALGTQRTSLIAHNRILLWKYGNDSGTQQQGSPQRNPQGTPQAQPNPGPLPGQGKAVSLAAARSLPQYKGMDDAHISAEAQRLGYQVTQ